MDRRVARTKKAIREAYFDLLKEKRTTKITISDISRKADIDRKTFYLHYSSPNDVLTDYINERVTYIESLLDDYNYFDDPFNVDIIYRIMESAHQHDLDYLSEISHYDSYDELWRIMQERMAESCYKFNKEKMSGTDEEIKIASDYFISGVLTVYRKWLSGEYGNVDLREIIEIASNISHLGIADMLNTKKSR